MINTAKKLKYIHILIASCMLMSYSDHEPTNSTSYCLPYRCLTPPHLIILTADNNDNINDYIEIILMVILVLPAIIMSQLQMLPIKSDSAPMATTSQRQQHHQQPPSSSPSDSYQRHPPTADHDVATHTPHLDHIVTPITSSPSHQLTFRTT